MSEIYSNIIRSDRSQQEEATLSQLNKNEPEEQYLRFIL